MVDINIKLCSTVNNHQNSKKYVIIEGVTS